MKKITYLLIFVLLSLSYACSDDNNENGYTTYSVAVQLVYPEESLLNPTQGVEVKLYDTGERAYDAVTDANGKASFTVPAGVYRAAATDNRATGGYSYIYNGKVNNIIITNTWNENNPVELLLTESTKGQIIIKELYVGGCQKDDGSGVFQFDKYVVLYNNSELTASLDNLCLGMVQPYNAHGTNNDYVGGQLIYENDNWIPAGTGIWYYPGVLTIEPGKEVVIALNNAVNNTGTYSNSVNFSNSKYYCTYDNTMYDNTSYYPAPDATIPTNHYWSAVHYGKGTAWPLSTLSPAFFIFQTKDTTPVEFANNEANTNYYGENQSDTNRRKKVPTDWILDAIDVFTTTSDNNQKRLTSKVDAGQTYLANKFGYTSYRNVDEEATKAIAGNESKLVYGYNKGTIVNSKPSTDASGIDAEASIKNGARIIYMDTNNSTNDFHQRKQASLRD